MRTDRRIPGRVGRSTRALMGALAGAVLMAGCVTTAPTPYAPATESHGGYSGQELEDDRVRLSFAGNASTSRETVENALLARAAEVTLHKGFDHFIVTEKDTERFTRHDVAQPRMSFAFMHGFGSRCCRGPYSSFGYRYGFSPWSPFWYDPPRPVATAHRYTARAVIVMGLGAPPDGAVDAYDARAVMARLGPTLVRPAPDSTTGTPAPPAGP